MDIILISLIAEGAIILVLLVTGGFLFWYSIQANKKIDILLEKGKIKDFKDIFLSYRGKQEDLEGKIKEVFLKIKSLQDTCEIAIQKVGVVRFNPFNDMGGNQSFVIAMLDNKNNGFVISSLFVKDGSRVYSKSVKDGKSDNSLSNEEKDAIKRAMNQN